MKAIGFLAVIVSLLVVGQHNRHDDGSVGCDFAFSGGSIAHAFAFLYTRTGDVTWLERAKLVVHWHWNHRHTQTNLTPDGVGTLLEALLELPAGATP